jgi:hypothetical protein
MGTNQFFKLFRDKSSVSATAAGPKNWGGEERLYSQDVEDAFEQIESRIAHLQKKLENGSTPTDDVVARLIPAHTDCFSV